MYDASFGDTAAGHSWPSIGGEYNTSLFVWPCGTRFSNTRGTRPLPVRPNHRLALLRVRDPKPIPRPPGTTGGPGSSLSDIRRRSPELLGSEDAQIYELFNTRFHRRDRLVHVCAMKQPERDRVSKRKERGKTKEGTRNCQR